MGEYIVHLRYYPGDSLEEITQEALNELGKAYGVEVSLEKIDNRSFSDGMLREETLGKAIEEITQDVITVASVDEERFREAIVAIYEKYRSPRTPYSFWGSSRQGELIARVLADETGGGW